MEAFGRDSAVISTFMQATLQPEANVLSGKIYNFKFLQCAQTNNNDVYIFLS